MADDYEHSTAAGENSSLLVANLGGMRKAPAAFADILGPDFQGRIQRHGTQILDRHSRGGSRCVEQAIHLCHGLIENSRDYAAMAVPRRASVALTQPKAADELLGALIQRESQAHARRVVTATAEAEVLLASRARAGAMACAVVLVV